VFKNVIYLKCTFSFFSTSSEILGHSIFALIQEVDETHSITRTGLEFQSIVPTDDPEPNVLDTLMGNPPCSLGNIETHLKVRLLPGVGDINNPVHLFIKNVFRILFFVVEVSSKRLLTLRVRNLYEIAAMSVLS
jgi:hypothetical protein